MHRLIWLSVLTLVACGTDLDQRPRTVEYITEAVLAPSCGNAQCHSSFRNVEGYAFDTVERAQQSLVGGLVGTISLNAKDEPVGSFDDSFLKTVLTRPIDRMPYDQGLPEPDMGLLQRWVDFGAPGAQCDPNVDGGKVCVPTTTGGTKSVVCQPEFSFGAVLADCAMRGCAAGACK